MNQRGYRVMGKRLWVTGMVALFAGVILLPPLSHGKDVTCQMPYKILLCQLRVDGNASAVSCFRNGQPFVSFQCTQDGSGWTCVNKDGQGGAVRQLSLADFENDVARCDRLCEFCVYDWQPVQDQPKTKRPTSDRDGKKCKIVSTCVEEGEIEVTKIRQKCTQSSFSDQQSCKDEPYQTKVKRCLHYEDKEVCE